MNLRLILLLVLLAGAGHASAADPVAAPVTAPAAAPVAAAPVRNAAPAAVPPRNDPSVAPAVPFDAFRLIADRNIFNPNRTGRRDRSSEEPAPRVDVISLVGTMNSDLGLRAFFDGSDPAFPKALHVGDSIDKFKVTQIAATSVDLERDGKGLAVRVGQQLRRPDGADWNLVGEDLARRDAQARTAVDAKIDPTAPPVIPANADDVTRRMMERRQKELKQ
jgi:hypothetical protein